MKLVPVPHHPVTENSARRCYKCNTEVLLHDMYADVEGKPFTAYYCFSCASNRKNVNDYPEISFFDYQDAIFMVVSYLRKGERLNAIKHYRSETGLGLYDAKRFVEILELQLPLNF